MNEHNSFEPPVLPKRAPFSGLAVTSMVFGIIGLLYSSMVFGAAFGLAAVIIGLFDRKVRRIENKLSLIGIILGIISVVVVAAMLVLAVVFKDAIGAIITEFFAQGA